METVLKTGQIAEICHVAPRTVSKWIDSKALKGYRVPCSQDRRVLLKDLIKFMRSNQIPIPESIDLDSPHRILLVGFCDQVQEQFLKCFSETRIFSVKSVASTFAAGLEVESFHPDCLLIDQAIGWMEAGQIVQGIRSRPDHKQMVLVAINGKSSYGSPHEVDFNEVYSLLEQDVPSIADDVRQLVTEKRNAHVLPGRKNCRPRTLSSQSF